MNLIDFPVEEFTTPIYVSVNPDTPLPELELLMKDNGVRHLPVIEKTQVVGIISDRDLKLIAGLSLHKPELVLAKDLMVKNPVCVSGGANLDEVALEMSEKKIGSVIVNDENDKFYGIFTLTDALNALIELVREMQFENRSEVPHHVWPR